VVRAVSPLEALRAIVEGFVGPRLDHLALYPCTVVAQRADKTLDLQPDDARVPASAGVPIRHGLPGVTVTVPAGGRVLLGYAGGNPALPYAALWESGTVTAISINGSTTKAARDGEAVTSSGAMATWVTAVSALLNAPGAVIGAPGSVIPPPGAIGAVSGGSTALRIP
jgi:hypothetical protein